MSSEITTFFASFCLGITLAAAAGMRVFLPLFFAGLVIRFGFFNIAESTLESQAWLGSNAALIVFGVATITEALAYKIPLLDHLLDVIAAPAALIAGSILATSFLLGVEDPVLKYGLGIVAGAGSAGIIHGATAATRLVSTKTTAGMGNPLVALGELIGSFLTSILAFIWPLIGAFFIVTIVLVLLLFFIRKKRITAN